jgi:hypothetical protein
MGRALFNSEIVCSDAFLNLTARAQALYFQLAMEADNDGFIGRPMTIVRSCGATRKEYGVLISRRFIIVFESGVCVIKHHWINNLKRVDRYKRTTYQKELLTLRKKDNGAYTELNRPCSDLRKDKFGYQVATNGCKLVATTEHNVTEHNRTETLGRDGRDDLFDLFWTEYPRKVKKQTARVAWIKINPDETLTAKIVKAVRVQKASRDWTKDDGRYIPHPTTWLNQHRWEDEIEEVDDEHFWHNSVVLESQESS